jgi:hypothetical protein
VLVRGDAAAGVQALLHHLAALGLQYSVGVNARQPVADAVAALPRQCWRQAIDADGQPRDGAQVAEPPLAGQPRRLAGRDSGHRPTGAPAPGCAAAAHRPGRVADHRVRDQTVGGRIPELELRHRQRARAEDRIRGLKDSGLRNLPLHQFAKNIIWLELVQLAAELLT